MEHATFNKRRLLDLLAQLQAECTDYLTLYVRSSSFTHHATELAVELGPLAEGVTEALGSEAVLREAQRHGTGLVVFWSESGNKLVVFPPFVVPEDKVMRGRPETSLLHQLLEKERIFGVVLVTWGSYAL